MDISLWRAWTATVFSKLAKHRQELGCVLFYGYYVLLVLAKALGYNSGNFVYKLCFCTGVVFWLAKMLLTDYSLREIVWLAVFLLLSLWMYAKLGELTGILLWMTVAGLKNCSFEQLMKLTVVVRGAAASVAIAFSAVGLLSQGSVVMWDSNYNPISLYGYVYGKPNLLYLGGFLTIVAVLYVYYDRLNLLWLLVTLIPMLLLFEITYCRTGLLLFGLIWFMIGWEKFVKCKFYHRLYSLAYVASYGISLVATVCYQPGNTWMQKINHIFSGRVEIAHTYYSVVGFSLFPRDVSIFSFNLNRIIDNLYMSLSITSGLLIGLVFVVLMTMTCGALRRGKYYKEMIFMVIFALYAILEEFPLNPSMNPFVMLIALLLYRGKFAVRGGRTIGHLTTGSEVAAE